MTMDNQLREMTRIQQQSMKVNGSQQGQRESTEVEGARKQRATRVNGSDPSSQNSSELNSIQQGPHYHPFTHPPPLSFSSFSFSFSFSFLFFVIFMWCFLFDYNIYISLLINIVW